jgi:hypothetical protein
MRSWRNSVAAFGLLALCAAAVNGLRGPLNARLEATRVRNDTFALPPPRQVVTMSLGYRSALADLIFSHVLVSSGIHFQEKRVFEFVGNYLETVNELDPKFRAPYRLADTLLTFQVRQMGPETYREARRILERGMVEFPYDQALWASAGQFFAYLAPNAFTDSKEQEEWKLAGARALAHACDLVGNDQNIPYQCITAAGLLARAGANAESRRFLERMQQQSDDPQLLHFVDAQLKHQDDQNEAAAQSLIAAHRDSFQRAWGSDLPFVTRGALLVIGPNWDPAACASPQAQCATSWRARGDNESPDDVR